MLYPPQNYAPQHYPSQYGMGQVAPPKSWGGLLIFTLGAAFGYFVLAQGSRKRAAKRGRQAEYSELRSRGAFSVKAAKRRRAHKRRRKRRASR